MSKLNKFLKDYSIYGAIAMYFLGCVIGSTYFNPKEKELLQLKKERIQLEIKLLKLQQNKNV